MQKVVYTTLLLFFSTILLNAQTADEIIKHFFGRLEHETLVSRFSATITDSKGLNPMTQNGFAEIRGEVFHVRIWDMELAFDGVTLASYNGDTNELTLSAPTEEELQQGNPLLYAKAMLELYNARFASQQPQGITIIELIPKLTSSQIQGITIQLGKTDLLPQRISLRETNTHTNIIFQDQQWSELPPVTTIPTDNSDKEPPFINDLR